MRGRSLLRFSAVAAVLAAGLHASPLPPPQLFISGPADDPNAPNDFVLVFDNDNHVNATGSGNGYSFSIYGDADPIINWSFSATAPGPYHMVFYLPVVPGTYTSLRNQGTVAISDIGRGTNGTTVSNVTINGQVPDGVTVPDVFLSGGPIDVANGGFGNFDFGPRIVGLLFNNPGAMQVVLDFTLTSADLDGSASFSGQFLLEGPPTGGDTVPEPKTSMLIGLGLVGVAALRPLKRRFH